MPTTKNLNTKYATDIGIAVGTIFYVVVAYIILCIVYALGCSRRSAGRLYFFSSATAGISGHVQIDL